MMHQKQPQQQPLILCRWWPGVQLFAILLLLPVSMSVYPESIKTDDYSDTTSVAAMVHHFVYYHKALKMGIVFGCDQKLSFIYKLLSQLMGSSVSVRTVNIATRLRPGSGMMEWASDTLRSSLEFHQFVVLDMECENAALVLEQASKYELFNASFHWLIIDKNYNGLVRAGCTSVVLQGEAMVALKQSNGQRTLASPGVHRCGRMEGQAFPPSAPRAPNGTYANVNGNAIGDTFELFGTMNVSINAEVTVARPNDGAGAYREFTLYDLWNPGYRSGGKLKVEPLGNYIAVDGGARLVARLVPHRPTTVVRRQNMDGLKLKIMTVVTQRPHQPFEAYLTTPTNTHLDSVHRYNYGLMSMLKDFYNFTFINRRTKSWGYLRNGTFDGMMGALSRREVDLGGSPMYFRQERHRVVSYTTRTFIERPCFIFRHPARQDAVKNPFLLPFELIIWYLMLACGTTLTFMLCISFYCEDAAGILNRSSSDGPRPKESSSNAVTPAGCGSHYNARMTMATGVRFTCISCVSNKSEAASTAQDDDDGTTSVSRMHEQQHLPNNNGNGAAAKCNYPAERVSKSVLLFLGGVCQQGLSEIPHLSSGRCTSFFILLFGYLMFQYYSASIVGSLLMEQPRSIKTLRNLIDSRLTLGIEDIPYSRDYFVRTTDVDSLELHRTRIEYRDERTDRNESHFLAAADGLQLVRAGGYAFHVAISAAYRIIRETFSEREICELSEIDMFPVSSQWMIAIVQKNSPYRDVITYGLRRLNEAGLMQRQRRVWQEPKPKCVRQIAPTDLIVGLNAVVSAFVLLIVGATLSTVLLIVEILYSRLDRGRRRCRREAEKRTPSPAGLYYVEKSPTGHGQVCRSTTRWAGIQPEVAAIQEYGPR
ncbi:ionotropic receptor 75a-like [Anopheles aquasalis]|uniref:ionotropic receptor 75a-like n=1 Tax=Anopheles aquasalis TaxID=42839 RepID=UPI00215A369F|nr:ionotropic receptor 75a-like [Anopheles aquasalis]